jgi:HEAT repeat protein
VAVKFIDVFLNSYADGDSLLDAVEKAQTEMMKMEELTKDANQLEKKGFVGASWLPVVYQNLYDAPPTWEELKGKGKADWVSYCLAWLAIEAGKRLKNNPLTSEAIGYELEEIYIPLGLVERRIEEDKEKENDQISPEMGSNIYLDRDIQNKPTYEITRKCKNDEFLIEVIRDSKSEKSNGTRTLIIGEPGAGKTTFSKKLADWIFAGKKDKNEEVINEDSNNNEDNKEVVIWIPLADLQNRSLEKYLCDVWLKKAGELGIEEAIINEDESTTQDSNSDTEVKEDSPQLKVLKKFFSEHQVWLILDGADEMVSDNNNLINITSQVDSLAKKIEGFKTVITCRLNVWENGRDDIDSEWDTYRNLDFTFSENKNDTNNSGWQFIERWFRFKPEWGDSLWNALNETGRERIRDLVRNPLRLSLLCAMWHGNKATLPETKAQLYSEYVKQVYEWKGRIFLPNEYQTLDVIKDYLALLIYFQYDSSLFTVIQNELSSQTDISDDLSWFISLQSEKEFLSVTQNSLAYFIEWTYSVYSILAHQQQRLNHLLGELSKEALDLNESHFRLSESLIDKILGESKELVRQLGWLNQIGVNIHNQIGVDENNGNKPIYEPIYAFYHASFQEYFVATIINETEFFLKHTLSVSDGIYRIFENKWREVYLFCLGLDNWDFQEKEKLLQELIQFESEMDSSINFFTIRGLILALRGVQEFNNCSSILVNTIINGIDSKLKIDNNKVKEKIIEALENIGSNLAVKPLISVLKNEDNGHVRYEAAKALGNVGSELAVKPLISALLNDENRYVRFYSAEALGKIGSELVLETLIDLFEGKYSWLKYNHPQEQYNLLNPLNPKNYTTYSHSNRRRRYRKLRKTGLINHNQIGTGFRIGNLSGRESIIARGGIYGGIQNNDEVDFDTNLLFNYEYDEVDFDTNLLFNYEYEEYEVEDVSVIGAASGALVKILSNLSVNILISLLKNNNYWKIQKYVAQALGNIESEKSVDALISALNRENIFVREKAIEALGNIGSETAVKAIEALGNIRSETAVKPLIEMLKAEDITLQEKAIEALGNIGSETAVKPLIQMLKDKNISRDKAIEALGKIGNKTAVDALIEMLKGEDITLQEKAIKALGKIGSETAVEPLIQMLKDKDISIREKAIEALGKIGNETAVEPLIQMLKDKDISIREQVADALWNMTENIPYNRFYNATLPQKLSQFLKKIVSKFFQKIFFKCISKKVIYNSTDKSITVDQNLEQTNSTPEINYPISSQSASIENQNNKKEEKEKAVFDNYTDKAIKAIMLAQEECKSSKRDSLGTEHLLLGLIAEGTNTAAKILRSKGIALKTARLKVKEIVGEGSDLFFKQQINFTSKCKEVIKLSQQEAINSGSLEIGTGHILLALIRMGSGVAIQVFKSFNLDLEELRTEIITLIASEQNVEITNSIPDNNPETSSQSASNDKKITQVYILLYNPATENKSIHTLNYFNQDTVLMFESEEDANNYALQLEAQDFPKPSVELIDRGKIEEFCTSAGYQWQFITEGMPINPPEGNKEQLDFNPKGD